MLSCPKCGSSYQKELERCGLDGERLVRDGRDLLIGRTIDRYQILDLLGDGGMARVYHAKQVYLGQECAIKVLLGEVASDRTLARRFQREAQASSQLRHPNVVHIFDFGQTSEGLIFMAMELLRGRTLSDAIHEEGALPPPRAAYLARQLAEGLAAAHALGFVHRDLKPKNVMLTGERGREVAKILDFGLVLITGASSVETTSLTQQGQVFGTPAYMAPEQVSGTEIGPAADLYALGVIIYQMLTGKVPFGGTPAQVALHHVSLPPPPLEDHAGLGALAMRCLSKQPGDRPASALEVAAMIDALGIVTQRPPVEMPRPMRTDPALHDARSEPAMPLSFSVGDDSQPELRGIDARIESSQDSLPPLSMPISGSSGEPPRPGAAGRASLLPARDRSVTRELSAPVVAGEAALDEAIEEAGLGRHRTLRTAVVVVGIVVGVAAGALYLRAGGPSPGARAGEPVVVDAGGAVAAERDASAATSAGAGADASWVASTSEDAGRAVLDAGEDGGAVRDAEVARDAEVVPPKVARDAGPERERPAKRPRPERTRRPDEPLVEPALFTERDRALAGILARRGLAWADLGAYAPEAAKQWALWRIGADRPTRGELDDTQLELEQTIRGIALDASLLETKLDRVRGILADIPEARRDERYQKLLARYEAAAHQLGRKPAVGALAAELTRLEAEAAALAAGR